MQKTLKKSISILLSILMIVGIFTIVPLSASAEVGDYLSESEYLTFTAVEANSSVTLKFASGSNFQYDLNGTGLTGYTAGTTITLANVGDYVRFRGKDTKFGYSNHVTLTGKVACSGNVMSLRLDDNGKSQGLSNYCFESMFEGCTGLTAAPELPETDLKEGCYGYMFYGCTNLTTAPELPATMLAPNCYRNMFSGCTSLTTAPELPATELESGCYSRMFYGCSSIKLSETQTEEYRFPYSVPSGGDGTTASNALDNMFAGTGGTFTGTPEINKTYYMYVPAPAQTAVPYMAWDSTAKQLVEKTGDDACADYTVVADSTTAFEDGKWYVVSESVTVADRITVSGTANLILCDGKTLTASNGITVETDNTLNIFAQSTGENMGKLTAATTYSTVRNAVIGGIGSNDDSVPANACGTVNIHGGDISTSGYAAYSGYPGAGIGGGGGYNAGDGGTVTIYGGKVTARGGRNDGQNEPGPGIGGGYGGYKGGDGGTVTIYGGTVTATGGIGGGYGNGNGGNGGTVIIYDGTVAAYGDTGIGGGYGRSSGGNGGNVEIYGGKVTTGGSYTVGIGGGAQNADHGTLTVGRAQLVYGGNSQNPTTIIKKVNNDYARYRFMTVDTRELADDHEHTFVYTASGNTISATCSVENCEFGDLTPITLTLEAPSPVYDGNPKEAVLSGYPDDAPQGLAAAPTGIVYYTATAPGSTETTGSALSGAPTNAGNFVAQVTWGGETLSVPFSIEYSLTINDGTNTNGYVPVYGNYADNYQKSQFVIPASDLTNLQGNTLTEMQFYLSYKASQVWNGTFEVYLGSCDFDLFSSSTFADISEHTKVYTGTLDGTGDTMNVVFDTGYTYTGGNLLVTFFEVEKGEYSEAYFYGVNDYNLPNYTCIYADNGSAPTFNSPNGSKFVPKVTFKYSVPEPKLFTGHSVTLGGDIGVNFFLNPAVLDTYDGTKKTVKFTVDGKETTVAVPATAEAKGYVVTCNVVAAQMAHKISAVVYAGDTALDQTDSYSVQDYAEAVYAEPGKYLPADDADKAPALKALAAALLHYGGEAQTVFATSLTEHPDRADKTVGAADYSGVNAAAVTAKINGEASDLNAVATDLNAKYHTNSLIYLQNNTLRVYFTPTTYPADMPNAGAYDGNLSNYYYYKDKANIAAAELDDQQTFTVGNVSFKYSPLNYVVNVLNSNMSPEQKNLAKSLFLYNQAANAFFDEPVIADDENIVDLATLTAAYEAQDGDVLTGELKGDYQITVAAGATVTLRDANITCLSNDSATANFAGITPLGDATILLEGTNIVKGGHKRMPGIYIPANKTLTIDGTGSLEAYSGGDFSSTSFSDSPASCGIGGKRIVSNGAAVAGGNLVINGGTITAYGGSGCAGIGSCTSNDTSNPKMFGDITINGGTVTASALDNAAGIGSGKFTSCGNITITGGTVTATGDGYAAGIGSGLRGGCGDITIAGTVTQVTATKGEDAEASIGAGEGGSCGTVTIADPSKVTQN